MVNFMLQQSHEAASATDYSTVRQFSEKYPAFTQGGLRSLIFNESSNGIADAGAIVRIGRKVLICDSKFFAWIEKLQNSKAA